MLRPGGMVPSWIKPSPPRTRGCSGRPVPGGEGGRVDPAYPGMIRGGAGIPDSQASRPRVRGDDPSSSALPKQRSASALRTRGCSAWADGLHSGPDVGPAYAGMFRACRWTQAWSTGRPLVPGDAPPMSRIENNLLSLLTPRTRGCPGGRAGQDRHQPIDPAHAGMIPC